MVLRILIGGAVGLLLGAAVGALLKSRGGTCPLTCNPIGAAIVGALLGLAIAAGMKPSLPAGRALENVPAVSSAESFDAALASGRPVLVDFYTDTCPYCVELAPTVSKLAEQYRGRAEVVKVNASEVPELARRYELQGVPTVILFTGGKEFRRWAGLRKIQDYQAALDEAIQPAKDERTGQ
jgi:thioredoxin 1